MAREEQLTLQMKILANGKQALSVLGKLNKSVKNFTGEGVGGQVGRGMKMGFGMASTAVKGVLAPLRMFGKLATTTALVATLIAGGTLKASAGYETLRLRMEAVMGTAEKANKAFEETLKFSAATPFRLDDLIDARITLEGVGQIGPKALKATAEAAAAMGRETSELAMVVASLETEPLRRLGIQLKREGERAEFQFRDRMGNVKNIVANGVDNARQTLLGIFNVRFGGATDKLAGSLQGILSTMWDKITVGAASFGDGLMEGAKNFISFINTSLDGLLESGKLADWGEVVGKYLMTAVDYMVAGFNTISTVVDALRITLENGPDKFQAVMESVAVAIGEVLSVGLVESFTAMGGMFMGIGKMMAAAFMGEILSLPGMEKYRNKVAAGKAEGMTDEDAQVFLENNGYGGREVLNDPKAALNKKIKYKTLLPEEWTALAEHGSSNLFMQGARQAAGAIPDSAQRMAATARNAFSPVGAELRDGSGINVAGAFQKNLHAQRHSTRYVAQRTMRDSEGAQYGSETRSGVGRSGKFKEGQKLGGGWTIIEIQNLNVRANDSRRMSNDIIKAAGMPGMAVAGT